MEVYFYPMKKQWFVNAVVKEFSWIVPTKKIVIQTKLKAFADEKLTGDKMVIYVFDTNIFSFSTMFSKAFFLRLIITWDCGAKEISTNR